MSDADRAEIRELYLDGASYQSVADAVGCSSTTVQALVRQSIRRPVPKGRGRLSVQEREEIALGVRGKESLRAIARRLGRAPSTISRAVAAVGGREHYRAWRAEAVCRKRARRPKPRKLAVNAPLHQEVERRLALRWSPQQIAATLAKEYPDNPQMRVSHETIYQSLYVQGRGALRKELAQYLRRRRTRRHHGRRAKEPRGQLRDMVMISQRPPEVMDRAVPGHWEGDLIIGKNNRSAVGTLVERHSRFVMLLHLPRGRTAGHVRRAIVDQISTLPEQLRRSLTWDQGKEMSEHVTLSLQSGLKVFFCDPHSPWQRGSNENTNGLLRQYLPKGEDLSAYTQAQLDSIAAELNGRPRQTLGWMTPSQAFQRAVASTT